MFNLSENDWVSGKYGSSLNFEWDSDYISIADPADGSLDLGKKDFTLMAWIKLRTVPTDSIIFCKGTSGAVGYGLSIDPASREIQADIQADTGSNQHQRLGPGVPLNEWTHVAVVFDRDDLMYGYQNGVMVDTGTYNAGNDGSVDSTDAIEIGRLTGSYLFDGQIDEVKIFDYALSSRQIVEQMNAGKKNNPIGYWSFDEGQGTTAYDRGITSTSTTGTGGNNGTLTNMSTSGTSTAWTDYGAKGKALEFDGIDDYVDTGSANLDLSSSDIVSVSAWVNLQEISEAAGFIVNDYSRTTVSGWAMEVQPTGAIHAYNINSNDNRRDVYSDPLEYNKWHHVAVIIYPDNRTPNVYINGELNNVSFSANGTVPQLNQGSGNVIIGRQSQYSSEERFYHGLMDELKVYNYALTLDEIRQNYNQGSQIVLSKTHEDEQAEGLIAWWKMDEPSWVGASGEIVDSSGAGKTGTAQSTANTTSTAKYGRAGDFNGSSDYVLLDSAVDTGLDHNWTKQFWAKVDGTGTSQVAYDSSSGNYQAAGFNGSVGRVYVATYGGAGFMPWIYYDDTDDITVWNHYAVTYIINQGVYLYVNGERVGHSKFSYNQLTNPGNTNFDVRYLGAQQTVASFFEGQMDDFKIYNYARSTDQIMRDYADGPPPVGYWPLDEKTGNRANDESGSGNTMIYNVAPSYVRTT